VTTRLALQLSFLISGSLIVAIIFNWPGMGPLLYHAVLNEDYPLSEASTFIISLLTIVAYSLIDYIHAWLDPRIKV
jgi:peptide/nickel transport system permease protein